MKEDRMGRSRTDKYELSLAVDLSLRLRLVGIHGRRGEERVDSGLAEAIRRECGSEIKVLEIKSASC